MSTKAATKKATTVASTATATPVKATKTGNNRKTMTRAERIAELAPNGTKKGRERTNALEFPKDVVKQIRDMQKANISITNIYRYVKNFLFKNKNVSYYDIWKIASNKG